MVEKSIRHYDASVEEYFILSRMAGSIITPAQRDIISSIHVLTEFQEKGKISKCRSHPVEGSFPDR